MSGLGAVLRASGSKVNVRRFLAQTSWQPLSVYWKGQRRFKTSRSLSLVNGFNVNVSDAEGLDLPKQIKDATRFLRADEAEFRRLRRLKLHAVMDFAVEVPDESGPAFFRFPAALVQLFAKYDIDLEVSYYGRSMIANS